MSGIDYGGGGGGGSSETGSSIKIKLESLSAGNRLDMDYLDAGSTNKAYTATEQTKLSGIQAGATDDQSAAEIKAELETLSGADRLDADYVKDGSTNVFLVAADRNAQDYGELGINSTTQFKYGAQIDGIKNFIYVNGEKVDLSTALTCDVSGSPVDDLLAADASDSGSPPSSSTEYYVYVSNSQPSWSPSALRLSATAPTNGYLGSSSDTAHWRYVGKARIDGSTQVAWVEDTPDKIWYPANIVLWHENSTVTAGNSIENFLISNSRISTVSQQVSPGIGDTFEQVFSCREGYYDLTTMGTTYDNRGILSVRIDEVEKDTLDWYAASAGYSVEKTISNILLSKGKHRLIGVVSSKNGSSSGYNMVLTNFVFKPHH